MDYFRQPALPQNVSATSLHALDGRTVDLNAMSPVSYTHLDVYKRQETGYKEVIDSNGENL